MRELPFKFAPIKQEINNCNSTSHRNEGKKLSWDNNSLLSKLRLEVLFLDRVKPILNEPKVQSVDHLKGTLEFGMSLACLWSVFALSANSMLEVKVTGLSGKSDDVRDGFIWIEKPGIY